MSDLLKYMHACIRNYVDGVTDVDNFRVAFVGAYANARNLGQQESEANLLASRVIGPVAESAGGHRSEASLRREVAMALRPVEAQIEAWRAGGPSACRR